MSRRRMELAGLSATDAPALSRRLHVASLVCFPTDTIYGIGGVLTSAVREALIAVKGRDPDKPLQVVFPSLARLEAAVRPAPALRAACRALLPGPVTLVVPCPAGWRSPPPARLVSFGVEVATLGVRVPAWPRSAAVLGALDSPLMASSANRSGAPPAGSLDEVDPQILAGCDLVLDAGPVGGVASTVVDLSRYAETGRWAVLRAGARSEADIAASLASTDRRD